MHFYKVQNFLDIDDLPVKGVLFLANKVLHLLILFYLQFLPILEMEFQNLMNFEKVFLHHRKFQRRLHEKIMVMQKALIIMFSLKY